MTTQIVVVTPIRNEARILNRFLSVTSQFADLIIVADQDSTDGSRAIYPLFPKVVMVENPSVGYDEAERQLLLLAEARKRVPGRRLILALDADELLAADAVARPGWETALNADPGTVVCFEKPDILSPPDRCIRYTRPWPLGYLDDGAAHSPRPIHSIRIPTPAGAPRLNVYDVKVLHFAQASRTYNGQKCGSTPLSRQPMGRPGFTTAEAGTRPIGTLPPGTRSARSVRSGSLAGKASGSTCCCLCRNNSTGRILRSSATSPGTATDSIGSMIFGTSTGRRAGSTAINRTRGVADRPDPPSGVRRFDAHADIRPSGGAARWIRRRLD